MGEVWLAERGDGAYEQQVAVKLLKRGLDTDALVTRFLRERRILARLTHPNIAHLLDAGAAPDGRPYLVMERIEGQPITEWCAQHPLSLRQLLELMCTVSEAVHAAHRQQIVHRDLKPSNVLVARNGEPKLLDFGIAKLLDEDAEDKTQLGVAPLTPQYAAPEQLLAQPVTPATDVYALGTMLYQLLAGVLPVERGSLAPPELARRGAETIARPSAARRKARFPAGLWRPQDLEGDLDLIVLKALQHDPARRYASASELADDLRRLLDGRPVSARPDSFFYVAGKTLRRHRGAAAAVAAVLLAILIGAGAALVQAQRASAEARRAERVKDFLVSIFEQADPEKSKGEKVTARDLLEQGSKQVQDQLAAEPVVQADLYEALARIYNSLGDYERGQKLAQNSLDLRRRQLPAHDDRIAASLLVLARSERDQGDAAVTRTQLQEAADIYRANHGEDSVEMARAYTAQADTEEYFSDHAAALRLQQLAYAAMRKALGPQNADVIDSTIALGQLLENNNRYAEAEARYREVLAALSAKHLEAGDEAGTAHLELGGLLDRLGRPAEAEAELSQAIAIERRVYGDSHPYVGEALFSRGILLNNLNRLAEAEADFREALRIAPPGSYEAAQVERYLGINLTRQQRYAEAEPHLVAAVAGLRKIGGEKDTQQYRALSDLALLKLRQGHAQEAYTMLREAIERIESRLGPEDYEVRNPLKQLGEVLIALQRYPEAAATLSRVRDLELKLFSNPGHKDLCATDGLLGEALLGVHTPQSLQQAVPVADRAIALCSKNFPGAYWLSLSMRGRLHLALGEGEAARADLNEALKQLQAAQTPDPAALATVHSALALADKSGN